MMLVNRGVSKSSWWKLGWKRYYTDAVVCFTLQESELLRNKYKNHASVMKVCEGLKWFQELNAVGHLKIKYRIDEEDKRYPMYLRGMQLGRMVNTFRMRYANGLLKGEVVELMNGSGFYWKYSNYVFYDMLVPCLKLYEKHYGTMDMSISFVVPMEGFGKFGGFKLGLKVSGVRTTPPDEDKIDMLNEMGFVWNGKDYSRVERVILMLGIFKQLYGHCQVPKDYIPKLSNGWERKYTMKAFGPMVESIVRHKVVVTRNQYERLKLLGIEYPFKQPHIVLNMQRVQKNMIRKVVPVKKIGRLK